MHPDLRVLRDRPIPDHAGMLRAKVGYRDHPIDFSDRRCREVLVDVRTLGIEGQNYYHRSDNPPYNRSIPGSIPELYLRNSVAERLVILNKKLIATGVQLYVMDGWRPQAVQSYFYYEWFPAEVRKAHPDWSDEEVMAETRTYWSPGAPSEDAIDKKSPPPHSTGSAFDVILATLGGTPVPMGSEFDEGSEWSHMDFLEKNTCDHRIRGNRRVFYHLMTEAGFVGNPTEWWHWSYGDQMWAKLLSFQQKRQVLAHYSATRPWS